jgi:hypothetical protein
MYGGAELALPVARRSKRKTGHFYLSRMINGESGSCLAQYFYVAETFSKKSYTCISPFGCSGLGVERGRLSAIRITFALPTDLRQEGCGAGLVPVAAAAISRDLAFAQANPEASDSIELGNSMWCILLS